MSSRIVTGMVFATIFICMSCFGPQKSPQEENVLHALSNIQRSLEAKVSYQQFIEMLEQAKMEIDILKGHQKNNPCFMNAVDKCFASYTTSGKAWQQKMQATDESRKQDMDLTLAVMQSFAALSIQRANHCFKN